MIFMDKQVGIQPSSHQSLKASTASPAKKSAKSAATSTPVGPPPTTLKSGQSKNGRYPGNGCKSVENQ